MLATISASEEADEKAVFFTTRFTFKRIASESLMFDPENGDAAASFAHEFLKKYTTIGFGALSKREIDLLLIQLLQKHLQGFQDMSDFDVALTPPCQGCCPLLYFSLIFRWAG